MALAAVAPQPGAAPGGDPLYFGPLRPRSGAAVVHDAAPPLPTDDGPGRSHARRPKSSLVGAWLLLHSTLHLWGWAAIVAGSEALARRRGLTLALYATLAALFPLYAWLAASEPGSPRRLLLDRGRPVAPAHVLCGTCVLPRPLRAKHCSACGVCVLLMDHHCGWLGNCVGAGNHRAFVAYLLLQLGHLLLALDVLLVAAEGLMEPVYGAGALALARVAEHPLERLGVAAVSAPAAFVTALPVLGLLGFVVVVLAQQLIGISHNVLVNEFVNRARYEHFKDNKRPFSLGVGVNWLRFVSGRRELCPSLGALVSDSV